MLLIIIRGTGNITVLWLYLTCEFDVEFVFWSEYLYILRQMWCEIFYCKRSHDCVLILS